MRVYLAGPMRGYDQLNFPAFHASAAEWRKHGHEVVNPAEMDEALGIDPHRQHFTEQQLRDAMSRDLQEVCRCDTIAMLPGWEDSVGARIEHALACMLGLEVFDANTMAPLSCPSAASDDSPPDDTLDEIKHDRRATYGDYKPNMTGTTQQLEGLLTQAFACRSATFDEHGAVRLPPWFAPLFLGCCVKGNRMASGVPHADNFDDAAVYFGMVRDMQGVA